MKPTVSYDVIREGEVLGSFPSYPEAQQCLAEELLYLSRLGYTYTAIDIRVGEQIIASFEAPYSLEVEELEEGGYIGSLCKLSDIIEVGDSLFNPKVCADATVGNMVDRNPDAEWMYDITPTYI